MILIEMINVPLKGFNFIFESIYVAGRPKLETHYFFISMH